MLTFISGDAAVRWIQNRVEWMEDFQRRSDDSINLALLLDSLRSGESVIGIHGSNLAFTVVTREEDLLGNKALYVWVAYSKAHLKKQEILSCILSLNELAKNDKCNRIVFRTRRGKPWSRRLVGLGFYEAPRVTEFVRDVT